MLDRSGNPDCEVDFRRHYLSSLTNLKLVGDHTSVYSSSRSSNSAILSTESVSNIVEHLEILTRLEGSSTTHNVFSSGEVSHLRLALNILKPLSLSLVADGGQLSELLNGIVIFSSLGHLFEVCVSHSYELDGINGGDSAQGIACIDRSNKFLATVFDLHYVGDGLKVQESSNSGHEILSEPVCRAEHFVIALVLNEILRDHSNSLAIRVVELLVLDNEHFGESRVLLNLSKL